MNPNLALLSVLSLAFVGVALPSASASAGDTCVEYAYVADYNWYYLCAGTAGDCLLYQKHVSGVSETRTCYVSSDAPAFDALPYCTPMTGDMDHQFSLCVGGSDPTCFAYEQFANGGVRCLA